MLLTASHTHRGAWYALLPCMRVAPFQYRQWTHREDVISKRQQEDGHSNLHAEFDLHALS